jgi:phosphohistidine phosphatase
MRTLYLLRHAKSSWAEPALPDRKRPLAPRGRRDAKRIAKHLVRLEIQPELVLCSSAVRTRETLERLRVARGGGSTVLLEDELYGASAEQLLERIRLVPEAIASVMLIGHNPGLQDLALLLAEDGVDLDRLEEKFPTAALATLTIPRRAWSQVEPGVALLTAYIVPKQLR